MEGIEVKFRYKSDAVKADIKWLDETTIEVTYEQGFEAVTPGQQAVFYKQWMMSRWWSYLSCFW